MPTIPVTLDAELVAGLLSFAGPATSVVLFADTPSAMMKLDSLGLRLADDETIVIQIEPRLYKFSEGSVIRLLCTLNGEATVQFDKLLDVSDPYDYHLIERFFKSVVFDFHFFDMAMNKVAARRTPVFKDTRNGLKDLAGQAKRHNKFCNPFDYEIAERRLIQMIEKGEV